MTDEELASLIRTEVKVINTLLVAARDKKLAVSLYVCDKVSIDKDSGQLVDQGCQEIRVSDIAKVEYL